MSPEEAKQLEEAHQAYQTSLYADGVREFLLGHNTFRQFLQFNQPKLLPGESVLLVCERALVHGQGLGLRVRVMIQSPQESLGGEAAEYFLPLLEKDFPWTLFQTPQTFPVVFREEDITPDGLCAVYRPALMITNYFGDGVTYDTVKRLEGFYFRAPNTMLEEGEQYEL